MFAKFLKAAADAAECRHQLRLAREAVVNVERDVRLYGGPSKTLQYRREDVVMWEQELERAEAAMREALPAGWTPPVDYD